MLRTKMNRIANKPESSAALAGHYPASNAEQEGGAWELHSDASRKLDWETHGKQRRDFLALRSAFIGLAQADPGGCGAGLFDERQHRCVSDIAYLTVAFLRQDAGAFRLHPVLERTPWFI
jgi:hypothetical protein